MFNGWPIIKFGAVMRENRRPYTLAPDEDANLVGMRLYGVGPFHRELKSAMKIRKKSHYVIKSGDIIYNKLFAWKGAFGIVPPELDGMFVSDKFPTYELNRDRVNENWLRWYFRSPPLWDQAKEMSTGSAALSKLTLNPPKFLLLDLPLPSIETQQEIVSQIEEVAFESTNARKLRQEALNEARAILSSVLRGYGEGMDLSGKLGDVLSTAPRNGWSARCDNSADGIPVLSLSAVTGFHYRASEFKRTSLNTKENAHFWLKPGDLLITRSNTPELVGHASIYNGAPSPCIYPDLMMRIDVSEGLADKKFVWFWLQSPQVRSFIRREAKGTSPTMKKISQGIVMSIPFPSSLSLHDQRKIAGDLDVLQADILKLEQLQNDSFAELDAILPSVLDRAFRGEL